MPLYLTVSAAKRNVPALLTREQMLGILQKEVYGYLPQKPESLTFTETKFDFYTDCCRSGEFQASGTLNGREFSFPFHVTVPDNGKPHPFFVHLNFRDKGFDMYRPTEDVILAGFAIINLCYKDVTSDDEDFTNGLAGATDTRFRVVCSNGSGCTGAALSRGKEGESLERICFRFPYWFCENYQNHSGHTQEMPFDQHFLIAASAPRFVMVGSASLDAWADPISEQLSCLAAAPAFGGDFQCDRPAQIGDGFLDGRIGYHLRKGLHYFSRTDWLRLMEFAKKHL